MKMLADTLKKLVELRPDLYEYIAHINDFNEDIIYFNISQRGIGLTFKNGVEQTGQLTQDWFDHRFAELGRECLTEIDYEAKRAGLPYYCSRSELIMPDPDYCDIWGECCDTKLLACESCLEAVVEDLERKERKAK